MKKRLGISLSESDCILFLPLSKRSQISIFVIAAIILVAVIALLIIMQDYQKDSFDTLTFSQQTEVIQNSFNECLRLVHQNSLEKIAVQGGYYNEPLTPYIDAGLYDIPFYFFGDLQYIPENELIQEELSVASDFQINNCFNLISERNFEYDYILTSIKPVITENKVTFTTNLHLTLQKGEQKVSYEFENFPIKINSKIQEMNSFASYIAYSHQINNGSLCVTCFTEIADDKELFVEFFNDFETVILVSITDNRTNVYPRTYNFALSNVNQNSDLKIITPEDTQEFDDTEINIQPPQK